jgi:hypothetical protein
MGKEFAAKFRNALLPGGTPRIDGITGAPFVIWYGEVSQDSDGPIEWCRPVPDEQAEQIAAALPELTLRTEPAHQEAYIHLESVRELPEATIVMESLTAWATQHQRQPAGAIRQILIGKSHPDADRPGVNTPSRYADRGYEREQVQARLATFIELSFECDVIGEDPVTGEVRPGP